MILGVKCEFTEVYGIQLDNEYAAGYHYLVSLKKMTIEIGFVGDDL